MTINFTEIVLDGPNQLVLRDAAGDLFVLVLSRNQTPRGFWSGLYLQGAYTSPTGEERPEKLTEMFLAIVLLAGKAPDGEWINPHLTTPDPGADTFTLWWTKLEPPFPPSGTTLEPRLRQLFNDFKATTGLFG